jgi:hypothetical protein
VNIPAFPNGGFAAGLTLRDYFAANAIIALIPIHTKWKSNIDDLESESELIATEAYALADAMLKVRSES